MGRITIKDIARLMNVNPSTVSRALKDHPDIRQDTRDKIKAVAKELGYRPNYQAIRFRQNKTGLIGLIIPEMGMFFYPGVVQAVEEMTRQKGYNLIVLQSNELLEREKENVQFCQSFGVDGILICLSNQTTTLTHFKEELQRTNTPVVFFDKTIQSEQLSTVVINDKLAAFTATEYLIKKGYRRISGIFGNENLAITQKRKSGYLSALKAHHVPYREEWCCFSRNEDEVKEGFTEIIKKGDLPDAVFAMTDEVLAGIIQMTHQHHINVPGDLAIIAMSNGDLPNYLMPRVTHIKHSGYAVGKAAAELLLEQITGENTTPRQLELEISLVELESC